MEAIYLRNLAVKKIDRVSNKRVFQVKRDFPVSDEGDLSAFTGIWKEPLQKKKLEMQERESRGSRGTQFKSTEPDICKL